MIKLIPLDINDQKLEDYQPHIGKLTLVLMADSLPFLPILTAQIREMAGKAEDFREKETTVARVVFVFYENVEISLNLFAICEYLRLVGKVIFWFTDDGICNSKKWGLNE